MTPDLIRRAIERAERHASTWHGLAQAAMLRGDTAAAAQHSRVAVEMWRDAEWLRADLRRIENWEAMR